MLDINLFNDAEWMRDILSHSHTGLWKITIDSRKGTFGMTASATMLELLGLKEHPSEEECYSHWFGRIYSEYVPYVQSSVQKLLQTGNFMEVEYRWRHPELGPLFVRCGGQLEKEENGVYYLSGYHQNISELERLKKENRLREREIERITREQKRYNALFESVICGIVQYTLLPGGDVVFKNANPEAIRIFGYTAADFWKRERWSLSDLIVPEDRDRILREVSVLKAEGDKARYEYRVRQKDGSPCWILGSAEIIRDVDGDLVIQSVFMDISGQKRMEQQNHQLFEQVENWNSLLRLTLENTNMFEFYYYPQRRLMTVPRSIAAAYGCREQYQEMPGSFAEDFVAASCWPALAEMDQRIRAGEQNASCEFATRSLDTWFHVTLTVISRDTDNCPALVVGIAEDITEKRKIQAENTELRAVYDFAVEHDYDCLCILDLRQECYNLKFSCHIPQFNLPAAGDIHDLLKLGELDVYEEDRASYCEQNRLTEILKELQRQNGIYTTYYRTANGRHKETRYCYLNGDHEKLLLTVRDIHEMRVKDEEARRKLRDALREAERANEAKSDFLSRMSHDIRTPMNAVVGMSAIAQENAGDAEKVRYCLNQINASSRYLLGLINDILDMSKIESGKLMLSREAFSVRRLVQETVDVLTPSAEDKHHSLAVAYGGMEHDKVIGDPLRLQQVLINILTNAVKYTPNGGHIRLDIQELPTDGRGRACFSFRVEDDGVGISPAFLPHIFNPFERSDSSRTGRIEGTGLGMSIAKSIVRMMDGDIAVESTLGEGSVFTVKVLLSLCSDAELPESALTPESLPSLQGRRILLVEDNELNQEIAKELLRMTGAEIETADNGREAVELVEASAAWYYDLILMDIRMPVMDGYEASRKIRALLRPDAPALPIIAMTADAFAEDVERARTVGMNGHVAKPIEIGRLGSAIRKALK